MLWDNGVCVRGLGTWAHITPSPLQGWLSSCLLPAYWCPALPSIPLLACSKTAAALCWKVTTRSHCWDGAGRAGGLHALHCHFEPPEGAWVWVWGGFELAVCPRYISEVSSGHSFSRLAASWCWAGVSVGASLDLTTNPGTCAFRAKVASHWGGCPSTGDWPHGEGQLT